MDRPAESAAALSLALFAVVVCAVACSDDTTPASDAGRADVTVTEQGVADAAPDATPGGAPPAMDGEFDDWKAIPTLATDPSGDASGGFDLTTVKATSRGTTVYLYFDVGKLLNAPSGLTSEGTLRIELTPSSGKKLTVDLRGRKAFSGAAPGTAHIWTELNYVLAPTYASKTFEGRVDLAPAGAKLGDTVTLDFSGSDALAKPASFTLSAPAYTSMVVRTVVRTPGTTFRVASLNTWFDGLTDPARGVRLGRLLKAVAADIYCFQEVFNAPAATIATALTTLDPYGDGATWTTHKVGDTVIATRGTLTPLPTQSSWQQHVGAAVDIAGRSLVVFTVRPVCCGHIGHSADTQRVNEMKSVAATIDKLRAGTLGTALQPWQKAPLLVIGDWNMVGSRTPLDVMLEKPPAGPGLTHHLLRHLIGDDVYTWYQTKLDAFPPGMLDLFVHSSELTPKSSYVLDTADLDAATLTKLGLQQGDSQASDHLMLVVDLGTGSAP
jgi:endonuclease/exonuclease/phosphatase family metal-dependent hydrolase